MDSVKILHCADFHIGAAESFLGAKAANRQHETLLTFDRIISLARNSGVQLLLIAGDLFDSNKIEPGYFDRVINEISTVPDIRVVFAAGNHDPLTADSPFVAKKELLPENLYILDTKDSFFVFDDIKTCVYGRSFSNVYMSGEESFSVEAGREYINIMVLHGELKNELAGNYNSITREFIKRSGMDYIALGHIHRQSDIGLIGKTRFAYCGCPEGQGFDELNQKGVYLGAVGKGFCKLEFVPTAKRMHIFERIDISNTPSAKEACEKIISTLSLKYGDNFSDNLYKIELTGAVPEGANLPLNEIKSRIDEKVYFAKIIDSTEFEIDYNTLANEISLKGIFTKNMLARIESAEDDRKPLLKAALKLGLKAFDGEVVYDEN